MRKRISVVFIAVVVVAVSTVVADAYSIEGEQLDDQKVFWGSASNFEKGGEVNYQDVVKATPEYESIRKKKIQSGTAKYWILISKASDHAISEIAEVGQETDYDLVAAAGYLGSLDPPIPADDITGLVLKKLKEDK